MYELQGNPASIASEDGRLKSDGRVSIVDTPAPAPFTPAMESPDSIKGFDSWMNDMQNMSSKQFSERIKGVLKQ